MTDWTSSLKIFILIFLLTPVIGFSQEPEDAPVLHSKASLGIFEKIRYSYEIHTLQTFAFLQVDITLTAESKDGSVNVAYFGAGAQMDAPASLSLQDDVIKIDYKQSGKPVTVCYSLNSKKQRFVTAPCGQKKVVQASPSGKKSKKKKTKKARS